MFFNSHQTNRGIFMADLNMNDSSQDKRLTQDDIERRNAATNNRVAGIGFVLLLIAALAFYFLAYNKAEQAPVTDTMQPVVAVPVEPAPVTTPAPVGVTPDATNSTDMTNQPASSGDVNGSYTNTPT